MNSGLKKSPSKNLPLGIKPNALKMKSRIFRHPHKPMMRKHAKDQVRFSCHFLNTWMKENKYNWVVQVPRTFPIKQARIILNKVFQQSSHHHFITGSPLWCL